LSSEREKDEKAKAWKNWYLAPAIIVIFFALQVQYESLSVI
jgi:hypothetical protein